MITMQDALRVMAHKNRLAKRRQRRLPTPKNATNPYLIDILPDQAWAGQRCFIVGGGPSLRGFDFEQLRGELVIAVNRAYEAVPWAAICFSMDMRFFSWVHIGQYGADSARAFQEFEGARVMLRETACGYPDGVHIVDCNNADEMTFSLQDGLCNSTNSGFSALNLACALGCPEIYLLGFDMDGEDGRQAWFHDGHPVVQDSSVYRERFIPDFERAAPELAGRVVNCNPASALRCFRFGGVPSRKKRPLVISYYTRGTGYEEEAARMRASAVRMGFEHDIVGIETRGGWQANTYYKAEFCRAMLDKHPARDLLWLDADVIVKRYPALFDNLDTDLAVNVVDWRDYPNHPRAHRELNTSVMYLGNNARTRAMLDTWIEVNRGMISTGIWEQKNLQAVLNSQDDLHVTFLPDTYCQIFDLMASAGDPVIELYQASRRLKGEVGA